MSKRERERERERESEREREGEREAIGDDRPSESMLMIFMVPRKTASKSTH